MKKEATGVTKGKLPTKYLDFPLTIQYRKDRHYTNLVDMCRQRIEGWMSTTLALFLEE